MINLYDYTGDASAQVTASATEVATAVRAPSRALAAARAATDARHQSHPEPVPNATAAPSGGGQSAHQPGPIEDSLRRLGVTNRDLLLRGPDIDRAGELPITEAAAEQGPRDGQPSATKSSRSAGTAVIEARAPASGYPRAVASQRGRASLQRESPEAEP
jgi:hypothetical protein